MSADPPSFGRVPSIRVKSKELAEEAKDKVISFVRIVPNFPKPGLSFKDLSFLMGNPEAFQFCIDVFTLRYKNKGLTAVVGIECRGFIFAAPVALALGVSFVPFRKPGKLPCKSIGVDFKLGAGNKTALFGNDRLEMHEDALRKGAKVLIIDDMLGTGATLSGASHLVQMVGGQVLECACIVEVEGLGGRECLQEKHLKLFTLIEDFMETDMAYETPVLRCASDETPSPLTNEAALPSPLAVSSTGTRRPSLKPIEEGD